MRGFTTLSERESSQQVRTEINIFFKAACDLLIENNALVDKFLGDAVMAFFNTPIPLPDHRKIALQTALQLQDRMLDLHLPFQIGIGLNSGFALTGNVGGGAVTDFTALGDSVNVASRLSSLARGGEILAGEDILFSPEGMIPLKWCYEPLRLHVKGKEQEVNAFRIFPILEN